MEEDYWQHARQCSQWATKAKGRNDHETFLSVAFRDLEIAFTALALRASVDKMAGQSSGNLRPRLRVIEGSSL
jgi:hypothetical protein